MIKILTIISIFFLILFTGCSSVHANKWKSPSDILNLNLQPGDIIVKEKELTPKGVFGHAAIMKTSYIISDYPMLGEKYYELGLASWIEDDRDMIVLRLKNVNEDFKNKLIFNMELYSNFYYKISLNKKDNSGFYCSQYAWFVYYITAKEFNINLDLDSDGGFFVFPYDFLNSSYLEVVK